MESNYHICSTRTTVGTVYLATDTISAWAPIPRVCLAEARERAIANRVAFRNGRDI